MRCKDRLISFGILFWLKGPDSGNWLSLNLIIFNNEKALSGWSDTPQKSAFFADRNMDTTCRKAKPCPPGSLQQGRLSLQSIPWDMRTKELVLPSAFVQMPSFKPYFVPLPVWERSTKETGRWQHCASWRYPNPTSWSLFLTVGYNEWNLCRQVKSNVGHPYFFHWVKVQIVMGIAPCLLTLPLEAQTWHLTSHIK